MGHVERRAAEGVIVRYLRYALLGLLALGVMLVGSAGASSGTTERVSVDSAGNQANDLNDDEGIAISADGRYVAFLSFATNLVPSDTNGQQDVFVRDRLSGTTELVSLDSSGNQANGESHSPAISADGRYVAFDSHATNLASSDTNGSVLDIFVRDRLTGATELVSVDASGNPGSLNSYRPSISADGRHVAFSSNASSLIPDDTNGKKDVFVHDRETGVTERVSVDSSANQGGDDSGLWGVTISADGRYVAFDSRASNLVAGDTNGYGDVFVHDRLTGATELVSVDSSGNQASTTSGQPISSISADGRYVSFMSFASNLVAGDTNGRADIFVHDRETGATERVSVDSSGNEGNGDSEWSAISGDGRYVAFNSTDSALVPGDTNETSDVLVRDRETGATERVSVDSSGNEGNGPSGLYSLDISADGRYVTFYSRASNLVPGDTNTCNDVYPAGTCPDAFVHDLGDLDGDGQWDPFDNCPDTANAGQSDIDSQDGGDVCDPCPSDATDTCDPNRSAGESIGPDGGTLTTPDGSTAVTIPPGCLTTDTSVSITGIASTDFELTANLGNAKALFSVNVQPSGLTCDNGEPFTIVFTWDDIAPNDDRVDGTSPPIKEDNLRITKNNDVLFGNTRCHDVAHPPPPQTLTTPSCDHAANTFTFQVSSFSDFAPVAPVDTDEDDVPDDFDGVVDNCPDDANPSQTNSDEALNAEGVTIYGSVVPADSDGDACDDDDDNDSPSASPSDWTDAVEFYLSNDPTAQTESCPRTTGPSGDDFWMPDNNHDRLVNSSDLGAFKLQFQAAAGGAGTASQRQDFNMDGTINSSDLGKFKRAFQSSCFVP